MSLPASGAIGASDINDAQVNTASSVVSMESASVRKMFEILTSGSTIDMNSGRGKGIVTSGLVMNLDAHNTSSYSGSGTTWSDLSGSANHVTLYGSPTYTSAAPSYFTFDGSTQYGKNSSTLNFPFASTNAMTAEAWIYLTSDAYDFWFTANTAATACTYRLGTDPSGYFYWNMGAHTDRSYGSALTNSAWKHVVFTAGLESGTITTRVYVNGSLITTQNEGLSSLPSPTYDFYVGAGECTSCWLFKGRIASVRVYNQALSAANVVLNYNAVRDRFGL